MEHQQATLEIISLLLAHGANSDEVYYPVSNNSTPHLNTIYFCVVSSAFCTLCLY